MLCAHGMGVERVVRKDEERMRQSVSEGHNEREEYQIMGGKATDERKGEER